MEAVVGNSFVLVCLVSWLVGWLTEEQEFCYLDLKWDCRRNWSNRTVYHTTYNACPDRAAWGREKKKLKGKETERRKSSEHNTISTHFHISSAVVKHWGSSCLSLRRCRNIYARCLVDVARMARWNKAKQEPCQTSSSHLALQNSFLVSSMTSSHSLRFQWRNIAAVPAGYLVGISQIFCFPLRSCMFWTEGRQEEGETFQ